MALADRKPRNAKTKFGVERPRLSPPVPARSDVKEFKATATELGISLLPWQAWSGRYIYARGPENRWLFPEIINVVSRQNGKTEILVPHIVTRLRMGRRIT